MPILLQEMFPSPVHRILQISKLGCSLWKICSSSSQVVEKGSALVVCSASLCTGVCDSNFLCQTSSSYFCWFQIVNRCRIKRCKWRECKHRFMQYKMWEKANIWRGGICINWVQYLCMRVPFSPIKQTSLILHQLSWLSIIHLKWHITT